MYIEEVRNSGFQKSFNGKQATRNQRFLEKANTDLLVKKLNYRASSKGPLMLEFMEIIWRLGNNRVVQAPESHRSTCLLV
jgi:hypothetical protein